MARRRVVSKRLYVDPAKVGTSLSPGEQPSTWTVMSEWTCSSCGRTGIPGDTKVCPSCASPKEKGEEYMPPPMEAPALSSVKLAEMGVDAAHSSDEYCPFCGSRSKPGTPTCPNCSANIKDVARTDRRCLACGFETVLDVCPKCGITTESKTMKQTLPQMDTRHYSTTVVSYAGRRLSAKMIAIAVFVAIVIAFIVFLLWPREKLAQVESVAWSTEISLEAQRTVRDQGWSLPPGAKLVDSYRKQSGTEQVKVGSTDVCGWEDVVVSSGTCSDEYQYTDEVCYDDGTCDRDDVYELVCSDDVTKSEWRCVEVPKYEDVPVYSTYFEYTQLRWVVVDSAHASGSDYSPQWASHSSSMRENGRRMSLVVTLRSKDDERYLYNSNTVEDYQRFQPKTWWRIREIHGIVVWAERNAQ